VLELKLALPSASETLGSLEVLSESSRMTLRSSVAGLEMPVLLDWVLVGVEELEVTLGSYGGYSV
jgi:hypothetical protein